jgi:biopolymer transport protein ExbD
MEFERIRRKPLSLQLTALIDVMFILIIFFMLTTNFMRVESLELMLPSAGKPSEKKDVVHLFIQANGEMILGQRHVDAQDLEATLQRLFKTDSATPIMLLTADGVTMQQLVAVMDQVAATGGKSLFVRKWEAAPAQATEPVTAVVPAPVSAR